MRAFTSSIVFSSSRVAKDTLMKIEHGKAKCQLGSVLQICAGLGIKIYAKPWDKVDENEWR